MATRSERRVGVRLSAEDVEKFKRDLEGAGEAGS